MSSGNSNSLPKINCYRTYLLVLFPFLQLRRLLPYLNYTFKSNIRCLIETLPTTTKLIILKQFKIDKARMAQFALVKNSFSGNFIVVIPSAALLFSWSEYLSEIKRLSESCWEIYKYSGKSHWPQDDTWTTLIHITNTKWIVIGDRW